ncbi:hypothetical protein CS063_15030 [Sporanaerobium hydrogeniformans]|uniref:Uncharacterized protein n=1 Tax=Sporanaerobium hydrogeniformans TaxID=3072179 RepID=A0AC61DAL6_9FIRM|nr:hypothetical protein [Sporanaerobium hydrogeniformans]PHV69557.1 hypothetical protein CS063_15030 [Sporanaerobium hydrogeniformans]
MILYLAVTADKYELPICVEDTMAGLAKKLGLSGGCVRSSLCKNRSGKVRGFAFRKIDVDVEEE